MTDGEDCFEIAAISEDEAICRAKKWREDDPFSDIKPSLLSSNEITKYVKQTAMIFPFNEEDLKTAAYALGLGAKAYHFDEDGALVSTVLVDCERNLLKLPANSIVFVECGVKFRLPKYIAVRFNLRIGLVHRGLLLGTGPLVDPGFVGGLLVPLHNLTSEDHYLDIRKHFIWLEFTKTTYVRPGTDKPDLAKFEARKQNKSSIDYLNDARHSLFDEKFVPIRSSIPIVFAEAVEKAEKAEKTANYTRNIVAGIGFIATIGIAIAIFGFLYTFVQSTYEQVDETRKHVEGKLSANKAVMGELQIKIKKTLADKLTLEERIGALEAKNLDLQTRHKTLSARIKQLEAPVIQPKKKVQSDKKDVEPVSPKGNKIAE